MGFGYFNIYRVWFWEVGWDFQVGFCPLFFEFHLRLTKWVGGCRGFVFGQRILFYLLTYNYLLPWKLLCLIIET